MAPRVLISLEDIVLRFGGKPLFDGLRLHVTEGDKICLIGRNGAGKTTLMRLICGELELDGGKRFALPGLVTGYLAQRVAFAPGESVGAFVLAGIRGEERETMLHRARQVIQPLGLQAETLMDHLSGGQLRRAALARALVEAPDLLLLDEPTNHLDLEAIEWLEQYLASYRGAVICVSHDRAFLSTVARKVFWIDRGSVRVCPGGYAGFDDWMETIVAHEMRALQNMQKKMNAEIDWTQGGVSGRRKRNQRRLNELNRLREKLKSDKSALKTRLQVIDADPLATVTGSKIVAEFKQVSKHFTRDDVVTPILNAFDLRIIRGDRIGIVGRNGSGKSTFLKLLINELTPDSGHITRGKTIEISYFDQNRSELNPEKTLWDTLCPEGGDHVFLGRGEEKRGVHVCGYLKSFLFDPKAARDRVSTLSGGQQHRLMLAKLLARPGNVMILDEPTNDLDMDTLDMLQEMLAEYDGTLIIVSHDRDFLDRTVTEILAFEGEGRIETHMGGYSDYHAARLARLAPKAVASVAPPPMATPAPKHISFKFKHEFEQLPARIKTLEQELARFKALLSDPTFYTTRPDAFDEATEQYAEAQETLEAAESRWLELSEMIEGSST